MNTLVVRVFEVTVPRERARSTLVDVTAWPSWAPHIRAASVTPPGPVTAETSGTFRFSPLGRSRCEMTAFDPPRSWTWTGRAIGVEIDYDHRFEPGPAGGTRPTWTVRARGRAGARARPFALVYSRLIDRAWPRFAAWLADAQR